MTKFSDVLHHLGQRSELHARFMNTLSLLEYIGARKIVKSQIDSTIDFELLGHIAEEIRHAQILKNLALKLSDQKLKTYEEEHLIAAEEARNYIQGVDRNAEKVLLKNSKNETKNETKEWINYLLTTLVVEERAAEIYPLYDEFLEKLGIPGKLSSVVKDEDRHLQTVVEHLKTAYPELNQVLDELRKVEAHLFQTFMNAVIVATS